MIEFLVMSFYVGETLQSLYRTSEMLRTYKKQKALFVSSRYFATPFKGTAYYDIAMNEGVDLYSGDEYRYAIFLNYMPKSFLESEMKDYTISERGLRTQFNFFGIENLIYSNEFGEIMQKISMEQFALLFNNLSKEHKQVKDLCVTIHSFIPDVNILSVYEYVGRIIEFCASSGVMKKI
jgi:hypothetical protein